MPKEFVVWGPPGTGKTTYSTGLAKDWVSRGTHPSQIAYLAFTKAAAKAAAFKIIDSEDDAKVKEEFPLFRTIHSLCYQGLRKAKPDHKLMNVAYMKAFSKWAGMEGSYGVFEWEDLADVYRKMQDQGRSEWDKALAAYTLSRSMASSVGELQAARLQPNDRASEMLGPDLMDYYETFVKKYEDFKRIEGLIDFTDMIEFGMTEMEPVDCKYVILDECQDLAPGHHFLVDRLLGNTEEIWWVGDDDQCLPGDEKVLTSNGYKAIRDIRVGEEVVSGESQGKISKFKVTAKSERPYSGNILKVTTESGKSFRCTPEHKVFCLWDTDGKWILYLMRQGDFFRIGITKLGNKRMNFERQVDGMMPIAVFDNETDARVCEVTNSLRFGIPTCLFPQTTARKGALSPEARLKIYGACDSKRGAQQLLGHYGKTWEPMYKKGVHRGKSSRKMVNLYPLNFKGKRASSPMLTYEVGGSREACKEKRLRKNFKDLRDAYEWLEKNPLEGFIFERWSFVPNRQCYRMMACNLIPQISRVPCLNGGRVVSERVVSVEHVPHFGSVYDIEVEKAHNFCAGGVLVSNCIFKFSGASAELFLDRAKRASGQVQLVDTHRFGQDTVEFSKKIIARVTNRHTKEVKGLPGRSGVIGMSGEFKPVHGDLLVLHRHVKGCQFAAQAYIEAGIPFRNERGKDPLGSPSQIKAWHAVNDLSRGKTIMLNQVAVMIDELLKSYVKGEHGETVWLVPKGAKSKIDDLSNAPVDLHDLISAKLLTTEGAQVVSGKEFHTMKHQDNMEYYERLSKNNFEVEDSEKIARIVTIHGAKGREADSVIIFNEMTAKCWNDPDTEHRLAYVAATRSRGDVTICFDKKLDYARDEYSYPFSE